MAIADHLDVAIPLFVGAAGLLVCLVATLAFCARAQSTPNFVVPGEAYVDSVTAGLKHWGLTKTRFGATQAELAATVFRLRAQRPKGYAGRPSTVDVDEPDDFVVGVTTDPLKLKRRKRMVSCSQSTGVERVAVLDTRTIRLPPNLRKSAPGYFEILIVPLTVDGEVSFDVEMFSADVVCVESGERHPEGASVLFDVAPNGAAVMTVSSLNATELSVTICYGEDAVHDPITFEFVPGGVVPRYCTLAPSRSRLDVATFLEGRYFKAGDSLDFEVTLKDGKRRQCTTFDAVTVDAYLTDTGGEKRSVWIRGTGATRDVSVSLPEMQHGQCSLSVLVNDEHIESSPFSFELHEVDPSQSRFWLRDSRGETLTPAAHSFFTLTQNYQVSPLPGPDMIELVAGEPYEVVVEARNILGDRINVGGEEAFICVSALPSSESTLPNTGVALEPCVDNRDGTYSASFVPLGNSPNAYARIVVSVVFRPCHTVRRFAWENGTHFEWLSCESHTSVDCVVRHEVAHGRWEDERHARVERLSNLRAREKQLFDLVTNLSERERNEPYVLPLPEPEAQDFYERDAPDSHVTEAIEAINRELSAERMERHARRREEDERARVERAERNARLAAEWAAAEKAKQEEEERQRRSEERAAMSHEDELSRLYQQQLEAEERRRAAEEARKAMAAAAAAESSSEDDIMEF